MPGAVHDVITHANFCEDRLMGFGVAMGRILAFSAVRVCDVMLYLLKKLYINIVHLAPSPISISTLSIFQLVSMLHI